MATKIVKTLKFPNSSDDYQINAVKLGGKTLEQIEAGIPSIPDFNDTDTTYDLAASKSSTNGNVKINLTAGGSGSGTDSVTVKGSGTTTVTTDANGVVTINTPSVDTAISSTSTNPVQNKVIKSYIDSILGDIESVLAAL